MGSSVEASAHPKGCKSLNPFCRELAPVGMKHNVGTADRIARALAGLGLLVSSALAPLPLLLRVAVLGVTGGYLLMTSLVTSCLGYRLIGRSTCPVGARR